MNNQYIDVNWLQVFNLTIDTVLDYFYTSPFYDVNANNEIIRSQQANTFHLNKLKGIEYVVNVKHSKAPHLFIISKQNRLNFTDVEVLEIFYILDGIIYQAPILSELVISRIDKICLNISKSFQSMHKIIKENPVEHSNYLLSKKIFYLDYNSQLNDIISKNFFSTILDT